jgi:hypothetical protein
LLYEGRERAAQIILDAAQDKQRDAAKRASVAPTEARAGARAAAALLQGATDP